MHCSLLFRFLLNDRTGKTICICNRMELDRLRFQHDPSFTQLFVSRSSRLCKYVKEVVGSGSTSSMQSFMTFKELLYSLDSSLPRVEDEKRFSSSQHVDYHRFARDFYEPHCSKMKLSALLVWKSKFNTIYCHLVFRCIVAHSNTFAFCGCLQLFRHF